MATLEGPFRFVSYNTCYWSEIKKLSVKSIKSYVRNKNQQNAYFLQYFFFVSLTVHFSRTLANDLLYANNLNIFITVLYMYMFRAISCSSSGVQIVLTL